MEKNIFYAFAQEYRFPKDPGANEEFYVKGDEEETHDGRPIRGFLFHGNLQGLADSLLYEHYPNDTRLKKTTFNIRTEVPPELPAITVELNEGPRIIIRRDLNDREKAGLAERLGYRFI